MMRWMMLVAALGVLVACGGSDGDDATANEPDHSAEVAAQRVVYELRDGNYVGYWERLHPDHQEVVSREQFLNCYGDTDPNFTDVGEPGLSMDWPDDTYGHIYGVQVSTSGDRLGFNPDVSMTLTAVDGEWRILLSDTELEAFNHDDCPSLWPQT